MDMPFWKTIKGLAALGLGGLVLAAAPAPVLAGAPSDWSGIEGRTITLFYPGLSTYDWLLTKEHKKGYKKVPNGAPCIKCHEEDEPDMGDARVEVEENEGIAEKNGSTEMTVQAAYDAENIYLRFQWATQAEREGRMHNYMRYEGGKWAFWGGAITGDKEPALYEDRLAIMIDDGSVKLFKKQGCWLTCHEGMPGTDGEVSQDDIKAHPMFGKKKEIRKYIFESRTDEMASWDKTKSADEIAKLQDSGVFLDLIQWRAARSNPVGLADDGNIMAYRNSDAGKGPYSWNVDKATMTPKFMFDEGKVGAKALTEDDIGDASKPAALIKEENAKPYDAGAGWADGDILPGRILSAKDASGSRADVKVLEGTWEDGTYTVVLARKLDTGNPKDDKIMKVGGVYSLGIAVHDNNVGGRHHHTALPFTIGIGGDADADLMAAESQ